MDLQNTYYVVGIIFMVLAILILLGIAILVFYIRKKIEDIHEFIETRIDELTAVSLKPIQKATDIAKTLLTPSSSTQKSKRKK